MRYFFGAFVLVLGVSTFARSTAVRGLKPQKAADSSFALTGFIERKGEFVTVDTGTVMFRLKAADVERLNPLVKWDQPQRQQVVSVRHGHLVAIEPSKIPATTGQVR